MKFVVVFLITFLVVIISAQNSYQQCGVAEQARIRQLEMEIQQLRNNNQALAAAGGMSAMNMLVGFLSGYSGSQNNNNKCKVSSNDELTENYEALSNTVKELQEQMSQFNFVSGSPCKYDGHIFFGGKCYFFLYKTTNSSANAEQFCSSAYAGGKLVSIPSQELYDELVNYIRPRIKFFYQYYYASFWTSGRYDPVAGTQNIQWRSSTTAGWQWSQGYDSPRTTSMNEEHIDYTHIFMTVDYQTDRTGFHNEREDYGRNAYPLCSFS